MADKSGYSGELFNKTIYLPGGGLADARVEWSELDKVLPSELMQEATDVEEAKPIGDE
ncbi:MAG: hypothetical protein ACK5XN_09495 [Bacteroidota bacterium]|jgi:hypothetical protein